MEQQISVVQEVGITNVIVSKRSCTNNYNMDHPPLTTKKPYLFIYLYSPPNIKTYPSQFSK